MQDFRIALRSLLRRPASALAAAATLALGIGLVATQFSLIDAILLRGLPLPGSERLVHIARLNPNDPDPNRWEETPWRDYLAFRDQQQSIELLAAFDTSAFNLSGNDRVPIHLPGAAVSANLASALSAAPVLGRWFEPGEDAPGQPLLAVLSHAAWQREFGGDPGVLGRAVRLNGEPATIIGVMPERFAFPNREELWVNLRARPQDPRERGAIDVEMIGKLKPGVRMAAASGEFAVLAGRLEAAYPDTNAGYRRMNVEKFTYAYAGGGTEPILYLMLAMTAFILALACVNVANMLLARAVLRSREIAVRVAVGAGRGRLIRQLVVEGLVLASLGALGGLALAALGVQQLHVQIVERMNVPGWFDFRLDHRVLAFTVLVTVAAGVLASLFPAIQASRVDVNSALKDDSRAASGFRVGRISRWLVLAQVAFTAALLVAGCTLAETVYRARQANLQHDPDRLLLGRIEVHDSSQPTPDHRIRFYRELLDKLAHEPGVESVAVSSRNQIFTGLPAHVTLEDAPPQRDAERPEAWLEVVSRDYFGLFRTSAVAGRLFSSEDRSDTPRVALVNASFARRFWPDGDPIGRRFKCSQTENQWATVVGIVPDLQMEGVMATPNERRAGFYLLQEQMGWGWLYLFVRTQGDAAALVPAVRRAVAALDPEQPVHSIGTLSQQTRRQVHGFTVVGAMVGVFAAASLLLGASGVYGVTAFAVSRRTREFGVRLALGSTLGALLALVMRQGLRQIACGLAAGLMAGYLLTRPLQNTLGGRAMDNPAVYVAVGLLLAVVGALALWIPARRAARVDPMAALRSE